MKVIKSQSVSFQNSWEKDKVKDKFVNTEVRQQQSKMI